MKEETKTRIIKGSQGYGYKYTDLATIHEELEKQNITYYQEVKYNIEAQSDYVFTTLTIGEETLPARQGCRVVDATLQGIKNPAQEQGSAITYARRYSLLMALGWATEDDDGASLSRKKSDDVYREKLLQYIKDNNLDSKEIAREHKLNANSSNADYEKAYKELVK